MRYLAGVNYGDGMDFYVLSDVNVVKEKIEGAMVESAVVILFEGELLSITQSGRGDIIINDNSENEVVYEMIDGDVLIDEL